MERESNSRDQTLMPMISIICTRFSLFIFFSSLLSRKKSSAEEAAAAMVGDLKLNSIKYNASPGLEILHSNESRLSLKGQDRRELSRFIFFSSFYKRKTKYFFHTIIFYCTSFRFELQGGVRHSPWERRSALRNRFFFYKLRVQW